MGKKKTIMKFPSIFKSRDSEKPWEWPSCKHPKTLSFRAAAGDVVFKTVNSIFFDPFDGLETSDSLFTNSSESASASNSTATESGRHEIDGQSLETVVRGARSERLFFEPDDTSSILEKSKPNSNSNPEARGLGLGLGLGYKESLIVSMESENPYEDFRKSMGEMVESHGVRDWEGLEELLGWYLRANWKKNHGFIIGAFVDLLVQILLASSSCSSDSNYYTCTESSSSSLDPSLRQEIDEEDDDDDDNMTEIM